MHLTVKAVLTDRLNAKRATKLDINIIYGTKIQLTFLRVHCWWVGMTARTAMLEKYSEFSQTAMLMRELLLAKQHLKAKVSLDE